MLRSLPSQGNLQAVFLSSIVSKMSTNLNNSLRWLQWCTSKVTRVTKPFFKRGQVVICDSVDHLGGAVRKYYLPATLSIGQHALPLPIDAINSDTWLSREWFWRKLIQIATHKTGLFAVLKHFMYVYRWNQRVEEVKNLLNETLPLSVHSHNTRIFQHSWSMNMKSL